MDNKLIDERYTVADNAICDAFLLLMNERDPEKITVSDVIKKAGIVRSTFYNHYENIPALITAIEDRTINEICTLMETFHPNNDIQVCRSYFISICEYTKNNPFFCYYIKKSKR